MLSASEGKREASEEHQTRPRRACLARHARPFHPSFRSPEKREKIRPVLQLFATQTHNELWLRTSVTR